MALTVRVQITTGGGGTEAHEIAGRVARMIAWLAIRHEQINHAEGGDLGFDYLGENIKPHLTERYANDTTQPRKAGAL